VARRDLLLGPFWMLVWTEAARDWPPRSGTPLRTLGGASSASPPRSGQVLRHGGPVGPVGAMGPAV